MRTSPDIEVGIIESIDPHGPFGAKEAGEGSLAAFLPALANAIDDAIGIRFENLPMTPDRVFAAIEKRRRAGAGLMEVLPNFSVVSARSVEDVDQGARRHIRTARLLGGGTDLIVNVRRGIVAPPVMIDVNRVDAMRAIACESERPSTSAHR